MKERRQDQATAKIKYGSNGYRELREKKFVRDCKKENYSTLLVDKRVTTPDRGYGSVKNGSKLKRCRRDFRGER